MTPFPASDPKRQRDPGIYGDRRVHAVEEQLEAARGALKEIVNRASGSSDVFAGHAARIARAALESSPASTPDESKGGPDA